VGERLGRGTGSAIEFTEFRDYVPGDDLRHVDWRAYARTDALKVRLFRDEVAPHLDLVLDTSASMTVTPEKSKAAADLASALQMLGERSGARPRMLETTASDLRTSVPLRPRGLRAVVSDFLVEHDPVPALRALAAGSAHLYVVQVLDPWELHPDADGARTLVDAEDGARLDLHLSAVAVERYRRRLGLLTDSVARATRAAAGTYALVPAADLATMLRRSLSPQGVVEPA
jgi:uncharacterized protein (DUF58 family)